MNLMIPSTHKLTIFYEKMPPRLREWQPSDVMAAALICRLYGWPLWTPISSERVSEFRSRVLKIAIDRARQRHAEKVPDMPRGLTRPEQHAVLRLGALIEQRELPLRTFAARLVTDDFWTSFEWHSMQRAVIPHFGIFAVSPPHLIIGASTAYAARKVGLPPPLFSEGWRTLPLNPLHMIAVNAGGLDEARAWHRRLAQIYDHRLPASPVADKIPEQMVELKETLADLEKLARHVLDTAVDSPAMLASVCHESADRPLGILERLAPVPVSESGSEKVAVEQVIEEPEEEPDHEPAEGSWAAPELRPSEDEGDWY